MAKLEATERDIEDDLYDDEDEGSQENQFLTFNIGEESYAIDLLNVIEIMRIMDITPIPQTHSFIKGIINLRGKIIPVMDVRLRFGTEPKPYEERTCIIVVTVDDFSMGLIVDHVDEVIEIQDSQIETLPATSQTTAQRFVRAIGKSDKGVKIILDLGKVILEKEEDINLEAA